jgi:putative transposase
MASKKRLFVDGGVYHTFNRGNHKAQIFYSSEDYAFFLIRLFEYAKRDGVDVLAYCLMTNHFHLLLKQRKNGSVAKFMRSKSVSYAKYHNWQYEQVGYVFQGRYGCRPITDHADLINVARYIHRNPGTFSDVRSYRWSDFARHTAGGTKLLALLNTTGQIYEKFVYDEQSSEKSKRPRRSLLDDPVVEGVSGG